MMAVSFIIFPIFNRSDGYNQTPGSFALIMVFIVLFVFMSRTEGTFSNSSSLIDTCLWTMLLSKKSCSAAGYNPLVSILAFLIPVAFNLRRYFIPVFLLIIYSLPIFLFSGLDPALRSLAFLIPVVIMPGKPIRNIYRWILYFLLCGVVMLSLMIFLDGQIQKVLINKNLIMRDIILSILVVEALLPLLEYLKRIRARLT